MSVALCVAESNVVCVSVMVNTACDREEIAFICVDATVRSLSPANISSAISAYEFTLLQVRPSTNGPVIGCSRTLSRLVMAESSPLPLVGDIENDDLLLLLFDDAAKPSSSRSCTFSM